MQGDREVPVPWVSRTPPGLAEKQMEVQKRFWINLLWSLRKSSFVYRVAVQPALENAD